MTSTLLDPVDPTLRQRIAGALGLAGIVLIFSLGLRSPTAMYTGMGLALIGLALAADRALPVLLREPLFWLVLVLFLWVLLRGWADLATADARGMEPDERAIWHHARFTPLLPLLFAFWVAVYWRHRYLLLLLTGVGSVIYISNSWDRLHAGLPGGEREFASAFGEAGLMAGTILFFTVAVLITLARGAQRLRPATRWTLIAATAVLALFNLFVFIGAQSRGAWLAMAVTLLLLGAGGAVYLWRRADAAERRKALIASGVGAVVVVLAIALSWEVVSNRLAHDHETIEVLLAGDVEPDDIPRGSFGDRYRMFRQGLIDISENPVWGVGPASVRDMLHEIWGKGRVGSGNYHNTWLNLTVAMGIPWTLLWLGTHAWALGRAARELIRVDGDRIMASCLVGATLVSFGALAFQGARLWSVQGSTLYLVLVTLICAVLLRSTARRIREAHPPNP